MSRKDRNQGDERNKVPKRQGGKGDSKGAVKRGLRNTEEEGEESALTLLVSEGKAPSAS